MLPTPTMQKTNRGAVGMEPPRGSTHSHGDVGHMEQVALSTETIRLGQLLKLANLVDSGAAAKILLGADQVRVNGEIESRRGRQLVRGDIVSVPGVSVRIA